MADIRTLDQLQDALDQEMAWRVKEVKAFSVAAKTNGPERRHFIRAGVALLYAHWEGFIKASSEMYLRFVDSRGLKYSELKSCFSVFGLKSKLQTLAQSRQSSANIDAFDFILAELESRSKLKLGSAINTESNLTSKVFSNIALSLDIDLGRYISRYNLIDESLVHRRNRIAHGEFIDIGGSEFGVLLDEILKIMREYKTDLENAASTESYKRNSEKIKLRN
ncbi:MAE_28990/MAE_18760 family HEPN-like nuclease [Roseibium aestuarii]|uniref:MAE_28990/MAE_18760 family HEPN-like nuclease n=1 Tax=Roseibium aestuarii TaxID=2600299 RepID=A0ABW4JRG5_9HYPH